MSMTVNLNYVKNEQKTFSKHLEDVKGIKYQESKFVVGESQILHLQSELFEVLNETKIHKGYDKEVNRERVLEELSDCLSIIGNISNDIDVDLEIETEVIQVESVIKQFRRIVYDVSRLDKPAKVGLARKKLREIIVPEFLNLVYSLGFNLEELKNAYFKKMQQNYKNPKFN